MLNKQYKKTLIYNGTARNQKYIANLVVRKTL